MTPKPTLLMLPPQTATTRAWAARLGAALPELSIVVAEDDDAALKEIAGADAAFGTLLADLVSLLATGRTAAVLSQNYEKPDEEKKRLVDLDYSYMAKNDTAFQDWWNKSFKG